MPRGWHARITVEGSKALLSYSFSKGSELSNPMDPSSAPTGNTRYVLDEIYDSPDGVQDHWQQAQQSWSGKFCWHRTSEWALVRGTHARRAHHLIVRVRGAEGAGADRPVSRRENTGFRGAESLGRSPRTDA